MEVAVIDDRWLASALKETEPEPWLKETVLLNGL
jgi:hypothetical protein